MSVVNCIERLCTKVIVTFRSLNFWIFFKSISNVSQFHLNFGLHWTKWEMISFFILTNDLIDLIGYKSTESKKTNNRTHLMTYIRKHFTEHLDYYTTPSAEVNTGRGGQNKMDIYMKKRPFKMMLMKIGTATSNAIH